MWGGIAASLVAVTLVGCSGGNEPSGTYKAADAERLATVAPRTPGWAPLAEDA
jgi:outer membrane lipoprotein SlyB